jgi:hypothetical protein
MIYKLKWEIFSNHKKKFFFYIYVKTAVTVVTVVTLAGNHFITMIFRTTSVTTHGFLSCDSCDT